MSDTTSQARKNIFASIRNSLGISQTDPDRNEIVAQRIKKHPANLIPNRINIPRTELIKLFSQTLESEAATVAHVSTLETIPDKISEYLRKYNLPSELAMGQDSILQNIPWDATGNITTKTGPAKPDDMVSLSRARAGAAETGTLFLTSGPDNPTTLNFMPDTHIILIHESDILGSYEDAWNQLRAGFNDGQMPRTVNLIGGPSRTADIEQTIIMGAHGPRRLLVIIVAEIQG